MQVYTVLIFVLSLLADVPMGMYLFDGVGGWMGGTEYQMGPLNFFILCGYIDNVYT